MRLQWWLAGVCLSLLGTAAFAGPSPMPRSKPASVVTALLPKGDWSVRVVRGDDGAFRYCLTQATYDSGHTLMIARNADGALNLGIGIPGARLPDDATWEVVVAIDDTPAQSRSAVAARPDLLIAAMGSDGEFAEHFAEGRRLSVRSDNDRLDFVLAGSRAALAAVDHCVASKGADFASVTEVGQEAIPEALTALLDAAGLGALQPIDLSSFTEAERPADYAWRIGPVIGGIREKTVESDADVTALASAHVASLASSCTSDTRIQLGRPESVRAVTLLSAELDCQRGDRPVHVAFIDYLTEAHLFSVIFHEASQSDARAADAARDGIARILRSLAEADQGATKRHITDGEPKLKPEE